jgi:hypothetical protein
MVDVMDPTYMTFGAWLSSPDNPAGGRGAGAFSQVSQPYAAPTAGFNSLLGVATYTGPAAGHYAERTAGSLEARSGRFAATATLTASFDDNNNPGVIAGSVQNFMEDGASLGNWMVSLNGTNTTTATPTATGVTMSTGVMGTQAGALGTTSGNLGGTSWNGTWAAQFIGPAATGTSHPGGITGTFNATSGATLAVAVGTDPTLVPGVIPPNDAGYVGVVGAFGALRD